eukprot:scaffold1972_cov265-Chaetoceros_neogracile.AAC.11
MALMCGIQQCSRKRLAKGASRKPASSSSKRKVKSSENRNDNYFIVCLLPTTVVVDVAHCSLPTYLLPI